ncbi:ribosomal RNA large subunit methyltransferase J [Amanita muscaria]
MRPSKHRTSPWIARQNRDPYVKKRTSHPEHYRSRSAFKLLEIDDQYGRFLTKPDVNAVVDLGAAPGGWSQVEWLPSWGRDTDTFDPLNIDNVPLDAGGSSNGKGTVISVDLLRMQPIPGTTGTLRALLMKRDGNSNGLVDVVLSDMAANAMKHFTHPTLQQFRKEKSEPSSNEVRFVKPPSSRTESREGSFVFYFRA